MITIPCGFRFDPSDDELIEGFLLPKLMMRSLPWDGILERDLYSEAPWKVFGELDESSPFWQKPKRVENSKVCKVSVYVFTKLKKASAKAKKISRTAGCGTWDGQTGAIEVKDLAGNVIGLTASFRFKISKGEASSLDVESIGNWTMHEYVAEGAKEDDFVLCRITKSTPANRPCNQIPVASESGNKRRAEVEEGDADEKKKQKICNSDVVVLSTSGKKGGCDDRLEKDEFWDLDVVNRNDEVSDDMFDIDELLNSCINNNSDVQNNNDQPADGCAVVESENKICAEEKKEKPCNDESWNLDNNYISSECYPAAFFRLIL